MTRVEVGSGRRIPVAIALAIAAMTMLGACASLAPDAGFDEVEALVEKRLGVAPAWTRGAQAEEILKGRVSELLAGELGLDQAVQLALINNPGLQASYASVGIAEAEVVLASRWRGPNLSFARLRREGDTEIERSVFFDVLGLLAIPLSVRAERANLDAARRRAAADALSIANETRKAWFAAVGARESVRAVRQLGSAAEAAGSLGRRMADAGNWSALSAARESVMLADVKSLEARVRLAEVLARERLLRLLGLPDDAGRLRLPERLPDLPASAREEHDIEERALAQRLDIQAARSDALALAEQLGLTQATRYLDMLSLGVISNRETGQPAKNGWELDLRLPVFDFDGARSVRVERLYQQALSRATETAIRARSEIRERHAAWRISYELAHRYRDEIVPLRTRIAEDMLLRYNGMLASVFELLADSREQTTVAMAATEALRDYWQAESDFQMTLLGGSPQGIAGLASRRAAVASSSAGH